jgi:hypothetical protein
MNKEELEQEIIELNKDIEFRQKVIDSLCETKKMYRDRIEKAIEYIEHYGNLYCLRHKQFKEYKQYEDLLDILKGE